MRMFRKAYFRLKRCYVKPKLGDEYGKTSIWPLLYLCKNKSAMHVAEIGVYRAESSVALLTQWDIARFYAIDPWKPYSEYVEKETSATTEKLMKNDGDDVYGDAEKKLKRYPAVSILRCDSSKAAERVENASLDFCFIDANHEYAYVVNDIVVWLPKMKQGGIFAGHDYFHKPVRKAVADTIGKRQMDLRIRGFHHSGYPSCWFTVIK